MEWSRGRREEEKEEDREEEISFSEGTFGGEREGVESRHCLKLIFFLFGVVVNQLLLYGKSIQN